MKNLTGLLIITLLSTVFSFAQNKQSASASGPKLKILYFHATMRCATCNAIENNAVKLLEKDFKSQLENGTIKFSSLNVDESANKALVEKYQISFSTLLLIKSDGKKTDLTRTGFQYALANPDKYESLLKTEIEKMIK